MITPFFRSSLLNTVSLCELRGFIEYSVGLRGGANKSALTGSTVHGVMELLALWKLAQQNNKDEFEHDSFGVFDYNDFNVGCEESLREELLRISYSYYDKESPGLFENDSYEECLQLVYKALKFHNGSYDPRNCNIYAAELPFEITLKDEWAQYEYETPSGKVTGSLSLKGTIDLVTSVDENTIECLDYKTSKNHNDWASGKLKVSDRIPKKPDKESSLYNDTQLMLYYYVLANTFPDKDIIMTLYFIRIDKAFTVVFDRKKDLPRIHEWLRERFEYIKSVEQPTWIDGTKDGWKCRWCPFNKNKQPGSKLSVCRYYQKEFSSKTQQEIMLANANYKLIGSYGAGGSQKNRE